MALTSQEEERIQTALKIQKMSTTLKDIQSEITRAYPKDRVAKTELEYKVLTAIFSEVTPQELDRVAKLMNVEYHELENRMSLNIQFVEELVIQRTEALRAQGISIDTQLVSTIQNYSKSFENKFIQKVAKSTSLEDRLDDVSQLVNQQKQEDYRNHLKIERSYQFEYLGYNQIERQNLLSNTSSPLDIDLLSKISDNLQREHKKITTINKQIVSIDKQKIKSLFNDKQKFEKKALELRTYLDEIISNKTGSNAQISKIVNEINELEDLIKNKIPEKIQKAQEILQKSENDYVTGLIAEQTELKYQNYALDSQINSLQNKLKSKDLSTEDRLSILNELENSFNRLDKVLNRMRFVNQELIENIHSQAVENHNQNEFLNVLTENDLTNQNERIENDMEAIKINKNVINNEKQKVNVEKQKLPKRRGLFNWGLFSAAQNQNQRTKNTSPTNSKTSKTRTQNTSPRNSNPSESSKSRKSGRGRKK